MAATKKPTEKNPRTMRDALAAQVLGDIDVLLDKSDSAAATITAAVERLEVTIRRLEEAGESYNQAVLAANMRSKKELMAYLKTVTTATVSATADEQRDIVRGLVRDAVSAEIVALKTAISELHGEKRPGMSRYAGMAVISLVTAIMTSVITVTLLKMVS
ncbi:MAG: hypothetical protein PHE96_00280 [Methylococcales bacterium]|nr:hypothetical protein [Methylococcales bacterium]